MDTKAFEKAFQILNEWVERNKHHSEDQGMDHAKVSELINTINRQSNNLQTANPLIAQAWLFMNAGLMSINRQGGEKKEMNERCEQVEATFNDLIQPTDTDTKRPRR